MQQAVKARREAVAGSGGVRAVWLPGPRAPLCPWSGASRGALVPPWAALRLLPTHTDSYLLRYLA